MDNREAEIWFTKFIENIALECDIQDERYIEAIKASRLAIDAIKAVRQSSKSYESIKTRLDESDRG